MRLNPGELIGSGLILISLGSLLGVIKNRLWDRLPILLPVSLVFSLGGVLTARYFPSVDGWLMRPLLWGLGLFSVGCGLYQTIWAWRYQPIAPLPTPPTYRNPELG